MKSLLFLCVIVSTACSSRLLVPLTFNAQIDNSPVMASEADSVQVIVENLEVRGSYLIFDMEINNHSDIPIDMRPDYIWYYASPDQFKPLNDTFEDVHGASMFNITRDGFNYKQRAMRPKEVEAYFVNRAKTKQGIGVLLLLAGAGLIINDAVKDSEDASKTEWTASDVKKAETRDVLTTASLIAIDVANESLAAATYDDDTESQYLPDEIFPQKTIAPGHTFRGKVFFRKQEFQQFYRLIIPVSDTDFVFDFRKATLDEKTKLKAQ